jgi:t-SNARE complex subunit (syntaxin)
VSTNSPPFDVAKCVDNYFRQQWIAGAKAKLAADKAAIAQPLENAKRTITEQADRITYLESSRAAAEIAQADTETKYAQEHDRAEFLNRLASWFAVITIIIIIIIFVGRVPLN